GASSGIGRAVALRLAKEGASVALTARRRDRLEALVGEIQEAGGKAEAWSLDLREGGSVADCVDEMAARFGGLTWLINSAGVAKQASLAEGDPAAWREMWEVNVHGLALMCRHALPHFPSQGGHVVNLCSMSGHRVPGKGGFYAPTKFAVRAITEGLRQELREMGNETRVSQVSPGFVETELLDIYFSSAGAKLYDVVDYPMLQPGDIAESIWHLLSAPAHVDVTDVLLRPSGQKS
ncbi:MAG: SDR family NAD(P)-dependent oxidoreductase, partial [Verrucomicrobiota bacterium]